MTMKLIVSQVVKIFVALLDLKQRQKRMMKMFQQSYQSLTSQICLVDEAVETLKVIQYLNFSTADKTRSLDYLNLHEDQLQV